MTNRETTPEAKRGSGSPSPPSISPISPDELSAPNHPTANDRPASPETNAPVSASAVSEQTTAPATAQPEVNTVATPASSKSLNAQDNADAPRSSPTVIESSQAAVNTPARPSPLQVTPLSGKEGIFIRGDNNRVRRLPPTAEALKEAETFIRADVRKTGAKKDAKYEIADDSTVAKTAVLEDDKTKKNLQKITLGTAMVDTRGLITTFTDKGGWSQRAPNHKHVDKIVENMLTTSIHRTRQEDRLIVSMTKADFKASVDETAKRLREDPNAYLAGIRSKSNAAKYEDPGEVPALFLVAKTTETFAAYQPVKCHVHVGQHRTLAMREYTSKYNAEMMELDPQGIASTDETVRRDVRHHYGWTVTIIDEEEAVKAEHRVTMNLIRSNQEIIAQADSEGIVLHRAMKLWGMLTTQEINDYTRNFSRFVKDYMAASTSTGTRIRRIFVTPWVRQATEDFTNCQWGRDLFLETRFDALINTRTPTIVQELIEMIITGVTNFVEIALLMPMRHGAANPHADAAKYVQQSELEAMRQCLTAHQDKFSSKAWLQLFFPMHNDKTKIQFNTLKKIDNYDNQVYIQSLKLPENSRDHREFRDYRRPGFLTFLTAEQYHHLYYHHNQQASKYVLLEQPWDAPLTGRNIFLPTTKWFHNFCLQDMSKFKAVLRLHWFLCCPEEYEDIIALAPNVKGTTRQMKNDFDMSAQMQTAYKGYRTDAKEDELDAPEEYIDTGVDDEVEGNGPLATDSSQRNRKINRSQKLYGEDISANTKFVQYIQKLRQEVCQIKHPAKDVDVACDIDRDVVTNLCRLETPVINFYKQILKHDYILKSIQLLIEMLGAGFLKGAGALLARRDIGSDPAEPDSGEDFFSMSSPRMPLSTSDLSKTFLQKAPGTQTLSKTDKEKMHGRLAPYFDVLTHSYTLYLKTTQYSRWQHAQKKLDKKGVPPADPERFEVKDCEIDSITAKDDVIQTIDDILARYSVGYQNSDLPNNFISWMGLTKEQRSDLYPHANPVVCGQLLTGVDDEGKPEFTKIPDDDEDQQIPHYVWISRFLTNTVAANLPYNVNQARKHYANTDAERKRQKEKNDRLKGKKANQNEDVLSENRIFDLSSDSDSTAELPSGMRQNTTGGKSQAEKKTNTANQKSQTSTTKDSKPKSSQSGKNTSSNQANPPTSSAAHDQFSPPNAGADTRKKQSGKSVKRATTPEATDKDMDDGQKGFAANVHENEDEDQDPRDSFDWEIDEDTDELPLDTAKFVFDALDLADDNMKAWAHTATLTENNDKAKYTKKIKQARLKAIIGFINRHCKGWDRRSHERIPSSLLRYASEKDFAKRVDWEKWCEEYDHTSEITKKRKRNPSNTQGGRPSKKPKLITKGATGGAQTSGAAQSSRRGKGKKSAK